MDNTVLFGFGMLFGVLFVGIIWFIYYWEKKEMIKREKKLVENLARAIKKMDEESLAKTIKKMEDTKND